MFSKIEKQWTTKTGLEAVVVMTTLGTRNGYIVKKLDTPLQSYRHTINFEDIEKWTPKLIEKQKTINDIEVHGGITYADYHSELQEYVIGFDCNHAWDLPDWETADKLFGNDPDYLKHLDIRKQSYRPLDAEIRTLDYCIRQCEKLAEQLQVV